MKARTRNHGAIDVLLIETGCDAHGRGHWCDAFAASGLRLSRVAAGADWRTSAAACQPALAMCDLAPPGCDGYAVCEDVRAVPGLQDIAVLLLARGTTPVDPARLIRCEADGFLPGAVDVQRLIEQVRLLLDQTRKAAAGASGDGAAAGGSADRRETRMRNLTHAALAHAADVGAQLQQRERALGRSNAVLQILYRMAGALNEAACESDVLETALDHALELPGVRAGWVQMLDADDSFRLAAVRNLPPALNGPGAFAGPCECKRRLLAQGQGRIGGVIECARLAGATGDTGGLRYHASIPLWLGEERRLGLVNLVGPDQGLFAPDELEVLHNVGNQVAVALERVRLHGRLEQAVLERTAKLEQEIEERRRVEHAQARLVAIIEATPDMVATASLDGRPLYCNPAGRRMLGIGAGDELPSLSPYPRRLAKTMREQAMPQAIAQGSWSGETAFERADGTEVPVSQVLIAHRDRHGAVEFLSTISRDITEHKRHLDALREMAGHLRELNRALENERLHLAERVEERTVSLVAANAELAEAKQAAEQASRVKSAFLATMSHEIRTPMNGVIGMLDVLAESRLTDDQRGLLATARESGQALLGIINDILDFSKIDADQLELEHAPVALFDLVEGVCDTLVPLARARGVEFALFIAPTLPQRVLTDDVRLRQILYNLLGNAIKFSAGDPARPGRVALRLTPAPAGDSRLVFEVADNGIGMAPETVSDLFQPFRQAEISTTRRFGGTGLGLAICKRLVDRMGGEILVRSAPGAGSVFTVVLPMESAADQPSPVSPDLSGLACIVLESPHFVAADLCTYLAFAGAQVCRVADIAQLVSAIDAAGDSGGVVVISSQGMLSDAQRAALARQREVRHLFIGIGRRKRSRFADAYAVAVDGDALRQRTLLRCVAVAAGRASPEVLHERRSMRLASDAAAPSVAQARAQRRLILVAEDDKVNQIVIRRQLALLGYAAELATDGAQALRMWREGGHGLVLTDLHMPEMDGLALVRGIRACERGARRMPIVLLSANALRGEKTRALAQGADDYLTKPVSLAQLKATLEHWLPLPESAAPPDGAVQPEAPTGAAVPALDVDVLRRLIGDEQEVLAEFLGEYRAGARAQAAGLRAAMAARDAAGAGAVAHKLKSSSRSVGALALGELCEQLEMAGKVADWPGLERTMRAFESAMAAVDADIDRWLGTMR